MKDNYITVYLISYRNFSDSWKWATKMACRGIQIYTRSKYFHTELSINGYKITSHTSKGVIVSMGTNFEHIKKYADIKEIKILKERARYIIDFAKSQEGKPYDWKGIWLSQFLPLNKHDKNKWFCNEIVGESLKHGGIKNIKKNTNQYNPGSFQKLF